MQSECLPFTRIPQTTPLFSAYLYDFPRVRTFYSQPPLQPAWFVDEARALRVDPQRRAAVADVLACQNRAFGSSGKALANVERLRQGACAVVTGQQVALFGGPLFAILKAVTAVRVAAEVATRGVDCVPVFWLATEDHDLAEVNHVVFPNGDGALHQLTASVQAPEHTPISRVRFGKEIESVVAQVAGLLGDSEAASALRQAYHPGVSFGDAFAAIFARWFSDAGVVLLDAADPALHAIAAPLYSNAIRQAQEIGSALLARGRALQEAGFHEQVKVTAASTLLFALHNGARTPVRRGNQSFTVGEDRLSEAGLLAQIAAEPERFSANVLLRPVVQDFLLPTLAYVGGPAEVAYFAQAAVVYERLLSRVTPVLPRFSATLVEARVRRLLGRYGIAAADVFRRPDEVRTLLAERALPADLQQRFDEMASSLDESLRVLTASLGSLDHTLVEAASHAGAKMRYQLEHLRTRAANAELRRSEVLARHARQLSAALHPGHTLQERVIGGAYFLALDPELLESLLDAVSLTCGDHQILSF